MRRDFIPVEKIEAMASAAARCLTRSCSKRVGSITGRDGGIRQSFRTEDLRPG